MEPQGLNNLLIPTHLLRILLILSKYTDLITAFQVSALSWQPGATAAWLAVGWESGELYLYHHSSESAESSSSSTAKKCLKVDTLHAAAVFLMQWSPAGSRLVTADKNGSVVGWKVDPGTHTTDLLNATFNTCILFRRFIAEL